MALIRPFRALRPPVDKVSQIASVPYDVVSTEEARKLAEGNPWSFLHVSRPEIDLPEGNSPYSDSVYEKGAQNLKDFTSRCPLIREERPTLYVYRLRMREQVQTGIAATFAVEEYLSGRIKKHEKTRTEKENDRTRHILELSAQTGPVFLAYRSVSSIQAQVDEAMLAPPLYDFEAADGVQHTVWQVKDPAPLVQAFQEKVSALYIADGHHRAAAASRACENRMRQNPHHTGQENYNFFYAVAFPDSQLKILPYHRLIKDLLGLSSEEFLSRVGRSFMIERQNQSPDLHRAEFGMYLENQWYQLKLRESQPASTLDVTLLQDQLLGPILGITDPRLDPRIDFVGGIRGTSELVRRVNEGDAQVAFSLHPTSLQDVFDVSDQGGIMPPKSTWFEPKLRDGILNYEL